VPADHEGEIKLPAVSGSSGRLIVERPGAAREEKWYPGRVFAQEELSYEEAMAQFAADSRADLTGKPTGCCSPEAAARAEAKSRKAALRQAAEELKVARRRRRQERQAEDKVWHEEQAARREAAERRKKERAAGQRAAYGSQKALQEAHRRRKEQRRRQLAERQREDEQWRQRRREIREQQPGTALIVNWIAILVITDNCTRRCMGLPLFVAGSHVTAEMVAEALRHLLPPELQFLISDRGVHFTAKLFERLAQDEEFVHVLIARHRPQSNGIAERFVRTLKEWLRGKPWQSPEELAELLKAFRLEYNDRPHQGLPVAGLSPNEYANRLYVT
jgi:transposase InsO family protein